MLVGLKNLLTKAHKKKLALGAFNAYNLETAKGIIEAAEGLNAPTIVETTPKAIEYAGLNYLASLIRHLARKAEIRVVLHLDHGLSIEIVERCLDAGYSSVMIDGSHLPIFENIVLTKKVVELAHQRGVIVEGEVGTVTEHLRFTNPEEAAEFVKRTGVDSLAVSIGSSHGHAPNEELDLDLLSKIRKRVSIPLVLHGASGVSDADIKGSIQRGIAKINIDTDLRVVFTEAVRASLKDPQVVDPRDYLKKAQEAVKKLVEEKILLFGSINV